MAKVSVIVPVYNVAPYLEECIESLQRQSCPDLQIILVNDGSTDESLAICHQFSKTDKRILIIDQQNKGHGPALNAGLKAVKGEYVMFCDGDDYYFSKMVECLYDSIKITKADVATCTAYAFNDVTKEVSTDPYHSMMRIPHQNPDDCLDRDQIHTFASKMALQYWAKIYNTEWLRRHKISFPNHKMSYDDTPFHWWVLTKLNKLALVRAQLYGYRMNREGASFTTIKQPDYLFAYELAKAIVAQQEPKLLDAFFQTCIGDLWWLFEREEIQIDIDSTLKTWLSDTAVTSFLSLDTIQVTQQFLQRNNISLQLKRNLKQKLCRLTSG